MSQDKIVHRCPECKCTIARKITTVGDRLRDDQYHYDLEWLVQCDVCKTVYTTFVVV